KQHAPDLDVFIQAEDGIRDFHVTGVQTCALPIYPSFSSESCIFISFFSVYSWQGCNIFLRKPFHLFIGYITNKEELKITCISKTLFKQVIRFFVIGFVPIFSSWYW